MQFLHYTLAYEIPSEDKHQERQLFHSHPRKKNRTKRSELLGLKIYNYYLILYGRKFGIGIETVKIAVMLRSF